MYKIKIRKGKFCFLLVQKKKYYNIQESMHIIQKKKA